MEQINLTTTELNILNVLQNLAPGERITIPALANYVGIKERTCYNNLNSLRQKGKRVCSYKGKSRGTCLAATVEEWNAYLYSRDREDRNRISATAKMKY